MTTAKESKKLGVIGGMGPAATLLFYNMVIEHTVAYSDQEHINMIIYNHATMPDRTRYIHEGKQDILLKELIADALMLENCGAQGLVITCNTAYVLADELQAGINIPLISIVKETARECSDIYGGKPVKIAILATEGTVESGIYQRELAAAGIKPYTPTLEKQKMIMHMIYDGIKKGGAVDYDEFRAVEKELYDEGCDGAVMGCTEMSVLKNRFGLPEYYLDAMLVLAKSAIRFAGKEYK